MLDTVIRGGMVVTPNGVAQVDVAVRGERIAALAVPGTLTGDVAEVIDATGKLVIPGGIDPHVHTHHGVMRPGREGSELRISGADPSHVSRAALFGGITTLMDFGLWATTPEGDYFHWETEMSIADAIANKERYWRQSCCDYALHVMLRGAVPQSVLAQVPEAISAGFPSFKLFMTDMRPQRPGRMMDLGHIWSVMEQVARHNGILMIHAEDNDIVMYMYDKLEREGRTSYDNVHLVHNTISEDLAFRRIIRLARHVEGAALYIAHVSAKVGVDATAEARADGQAVYGETLPHYATFTADAYLRPDGALYHTFPSLKYEEDRERLWSGLREGSVNTFATDEICTPRDVKLQSKTIYDVSGGYVGVETLLPVVYTEGVSKRGLSLERFVAITSTNAARILGLFPRKGVIAVGSDADIVIFDPTIRRTIRAEELHESDYTIWEGWEAHGWPVLTMLRGKVVIEDGQFRGKAGDGQSVPRKISPEVLSGPAVM